MNNMHESKKTANASFAQQAEAHVIMFNKNFARLPSVYSTISSHAAKSNQTNYFIVRLKVDQLSLPHLGITKTEKIELKHKTDEQISPVYSLQP